MPTGGLRVLIPSIVDPAVERGGAWTVTRGLVDLLQCDPWHAKVTVLAPPEPQWRRFRQATSLLAAPWSDVPAKIRFLRTRSYRHRVQQELARGAFDLLIINGSDLLWCLDEAPAGCPVLALVHNCESRIFSEHVAITFPRIRFLRHWLSSETNRLRNFELAGVRRVQAALFLSTDDAMEFTHAIPGLEHLVLPPQFPGPPLRITKPRSNWLDLGFLANFAWWPNRDGAKWMVQQVLDNVPGDVRLHLIGQGSRELFQSHSRLIAHGFVDDLREVWATCDWMVIPTRHGSGVSVKTAESLYHGMPVLSTHFGLRGLPKITHPLIVRCDTAEEWIAFLSGPDARAAAGSRLPLEVSTPFDLPSSAPRFNRFLSRFGPAMWS